MSRPLQYQEFGPCTHVVSLSRLRPSDSETSAKLNCRVNVDTHFEMCGFSYAENRKTGGLEEHFGTVAPKVYGRKTSASSGCRQAVVVPLPGGRSELTDGVGLASGKQP